MLVQKRPFRDQNTESGVINASHLSHSLGWMFYCRQATKSVARDHVVVVLLGSLSPSRPFRLGEAVATANDVDLEET